MKPRIAVISSSIDIIRQKHLVDWYLGLLEKGLKIQLFLGSKNSEIPVATNYKVNSKVERLKYVFLNWSKFKKVPKKISPIQPLAAYKPGVIHLLKSNVFQRIEPILEDPSIKLIVSFRGFDINVFPLQSDENKIITQLIFDRANLLHFVSEDLKNTAISLNADPKKCIVINRSILVDPNNNVHFRRQKSCRIRIVSVGRLVWEKGYIYGLETMAILKRKGYEFDYQVVGSGHDMNMLRFHIERLGLTNQVQFLGQLKAEKVKEILTNSDIYFQPSLIEGIPNSIYEALYHKLPIVSSRIGGIPEVVEEGMTGFLSDPCESAGYASNIIKLIEDPQMRIQMGEKGYNRIINDFSRENELKKWQEVYGSLK